MMIIAKILSLFTYIFITGYLYFSLPLKNVDWFMGWACIFVICFCAITAAVGFTSEAIKSFKGD